MASFFDEIARNKLKSLLILFIFSFFFSVVIYFAVFYLFGGGFIAFSIGVALVVLYAIFTYYNGDKLVLTVSRAKEADRTQYADLYASVEGLSAAMQIKMPKVYVIRDPNPNAFATGRRGKPSVAFTTGLLQMMSRDEIDGVVSHELSHVSDNDILVMTIAIAFVGAIGLIAAFTRSMLFWGFGFGGRGGGRGNMGMVLLIAFAIGLLAPLFAILMQLAISRKREYMADANGARVTRNPAQLASALKKIESYEKNPRAAPVMHANEITASLYFATPFKRGSIMNLFSTHPPIDERIKRLEVMY